MTRKILSVTGSDAAHFLQGLITNDVSKADQGLVYAALLTPQGKFLFDFFVLRDGDGFLIDVAADQAAGLMQRLSMYKLRADVAIAKTDLQVASGVGDTPEGALADPRDPALGWRVYGTEGGDDDTDWDAIRVAQCVPGTGIELGPDTFILEAGFERLNGVDFRKGCYVGQEVTARMKHKTELRKGLVTVDVDGTAPIGTVIMAGGKEAGVLYTQAGGKGIAYLRFDRAKGDMTAGAARVTWADG